MRARPNPYLADIPNRDIATPPIPPAGFEVFLESFTPHPSAQLHSVPPRVA